MCSPDPVFGSSVSCTGKPDHVYDKIVQGHGHIYHSGQLLAIMVLVFLKSYVCESAKKWNVDNRRW